VAQPKTSDFVLASLRGGQNDTDPPHAISDDECVLAKNVEFLSSTLGERRLGCEELDITGAAIASKTHIAFLAAHLPQGVDIQDSQLFAIGATPEVSTAISYYSGGIWTDISPTDTPSAVTPEVFQANAVSAHGKLFVAYKSGHNRMHVWDGTSWRRTGMDTPSTPTAADTAVAGSFTGTRYYRVRYIEKNVSGTILRRSEPSDERTFSPSGTKNGAIITRPSLVNEGETDWELEASDGDGNFYRIATTPVGTTTYTDTTQPAANYADSTLSDDIGNYTNIESVKFVIADQDRIIFGGSWEDTTHGSRISWTPVSTATGVGNDERIPTETNNFIDLDWQEAGELTGLSQVINGSFYAFKHTRIYKIQRTGQLNKAYESYLWSTARGAIQGSIVNGLDETGRPCVYFLDPAVGPCRISSAGIQLMQGLRGTWEAVNTQALEVIAHGVFYPDKFQVHWWVSFEGAHSPNYKIISQTTELQPDQGGTTRGWAVADGTIANAYCSCILPEPVEDPITGDISVSYRPFTGTNALTGNRAQIMRCDINDDDNGDEYQAVIQTKPYILTGLLQKFGAMNAAMLARPLDDQDVSLNVTFIRDFGKERVTVNTDFLAESDETVVRKFFDNLFMSGAYALQIEFSDPDITE
jgi:hypothetical protein